MAYVKVAQPVAPRDRVLRRPQHSFHIRARPWQIQPFMIAPVLPGETLKNLLLQARVATDPLINPLIGWWQEYYFFYVKHRDLYDRDKIVDMHINNASMATLDAATKVEYYHTNGADNAISWVGLCMERIVDEYFRYEGEAFDTAAGLLGNVPMVQVGNSTIVDSAINDTDFTATADDPDLVGAGSLYGTSIRPSEIEAAMRTWSLQRANKTTDMTFEDYLRTFGIKIPEAEEEHKPELLRYVREWTYPSVTVNATNGTPTSACVWSVQERADKDRWFIEPGFVVGVTVSRPKVYLKNLDSAAVMLMRDQGSWLPAIMNDDPYTSMVKVSASDPPLDANTAAYWVDVRDLLLNGDQFINFALTATDANIVALPRAALASTDKRYPVSADADALFANASPLNQIRQDGIVALSILGRQVDNTVTRVGTNTTV